MKNYDAIIIGGGNGGLSCAAQLSKAGKSVLLLEKNNVPGGAASSFVRGRFEFEPSLHELCDIGPVDKPKHVRKMFNDLGANVNFALDPWTYRAVCLDPECPFDVTMPSGWDAFKKKLIEEVPEAEESIELLFKDARIALDDLSRLQHGKMSRVELLLKHNLFMKFATHTVDEIVEMYGIPKKAQYIVDVYWPYIGEPTGIQIAIYLFLILDLYIPDGAAIPEHTSHELSIALDRVIRSNGGDIFYNSKVEKILMEDSKAIGVMANGKTYYGKHIVSNVNQNYVFGKMIDKEFVSEKDIKLCNAREINVAFFAVYLGLNKTAEEIGIKDYTLFLMDKADPNEQYKESFGLGGDGFSIYNCRNVILPDCTPKGTCEFYITTSTYSDEWKNVKPQDYKRIKYEIADKMISAYEKAFGINIKPYIEEISVATPVTFARYLGTPNGTPYGYRTPSWDSILPRNVSMYEEQSIPNLWFVGASTEQGDGYEPAYRTGERAARDIIKKLEGK